VATSEHYDAVIVGAGQAGGPLSGALARAGWTVALVERKHVGGTCVNEGCTPTKTMVASARAAHVVRCAEALGVHTAALTVDLEAVRERTRRIVERFRAGSLRRIEETQGLDLIRGVGRFAGRGEVEVESPDGSTRKLSADAILLNTGLCPTVPQLEGLAHIPYLDSTSIMELDALPGHLVILGGGYIGVEFAQMFRRFGSEVTILQRGAQLLRREDEDIASEVAEILCDEGIDVRLDTVALRVSSAPDGAIDVETETAGEETTIRGSHLLVAVGRSPNTEELNLPAAGLEPNDRGFVPTNERLETAAPGILALGDVKGGPAFTHIAYDDYRIARRNLLGEGGASIEGRLVPYTVFMDPQLGGIGLTEREAAREGRAVLVAKMPMSHVSRALEIEEARGVMKVLVDPVTKLIVGASILGYEGGEVMSILQMAMMGRLPYTSLRDAVFSHPSIAESLNTLFGMI
jgi:pyruvate/2-oxoglutarate dehydrogenase complex dihydrolipoamide dehydrogenase (E3) component